MRPAEDLTGRQFGWLRVIERCGDMQDGRVLWLCLCACGTKTNVKVGHLKQGNVTSCGCRRRIQYAKSLKSTKGLLATGGGRTVFLDEDWHS